MKERPILFTGDMVRAILDGRKTQTRRVIKPQPDARHCSLDYEHKCPYGAPGDLLWVREGAWCYEDRPIGRNGQIKWPKTFVSKGHAKKWLRTNCVYEADVTQNIYKPIKRRGGLLNRLFMPRWASRLTLEVKSIRAERVQDITEEDAKAEGAEPENAEANCPGGAYKNGFCELWDSINKAKGFGWAANPYCWIIEFSLLKGKKR